jgi:hypothetical protein
MLSVIITFLKCCILLKKLDILIITKLLSTILTMASLSFVIYSMGPSWKYLQSNPKMTLSSTYLSIESAF